MSPFPTSVPTQGLGTINLTHIPPSSSTLSNLSYQYPLKLIAPIAQSAEDNTAVQTVYLLTYGGGLVAGDTISLSVNLATNTRLVLLSQGSAKIFKSPPITTTSTRSAILRCSQTTVVDVAPGAALCWLPDPVQPFEDSDFEQKQVYRMISPDSNGVEGSLCVLDWVCQGRKARGENWGMRRYVSRNDVWGVDSQSQGGGKAGKKRLMLRDNLVLEKDDYASIESSESYAERMHGTGVFGTLILYGPKCQGIAKHFHDEFKLIPRIGGRQWDAEDEQRKPSGVEARRSQRLEMEKTDGLLWTVASLRGCTVVKFGAREVEGGRKWLRWMLEDEGSVIRLFGERALLCLR